MREVPLHRKARPPVVSPHDAASSHGEEKRCPTSRSELVSPKDESEAIAERPPTALQRSAVPIKRFFCLAFIFLTLNLINAQQLPPLESLEIANPNPVGSGARALGQGNAFIAVADDATAASWNPAGITLLEKPEFSFALETISRRVSTGLTADSPDSLDWWDFNFASFVVPFKYKRNVVISLNYLKLHRFDRENTLPIDIATTLSDGTPLTIVGDYSFDQQGSFSVLAPAFGIDITPDLSVGCTLNIWDHAVTGSSAFEKTEISATRVTLGSTQATQPPLVEKNRFEVDHGYSGVLGGLYRIGETWTLGGVIKPPYKLDISHTTKLSLGFRQDNDSALEFPWILGGGAAWRPYDPLTISTDVTWTQWSEYRYRESGQDSNPLTGSSEPLDDTFTLRLGGEYVFEGEQLLFPFRFGIGYDPAPAVDSVDDYYTVSLGAGVQFGDHMNCDLGYEFRWGNDVNGEPLKGFDTAQDIRQHRVLVSLIYYY